MDLATNRRRTLLPGGRQAFWSADGRELAVIQEDKDYNECGLVLELPSGKERYRSRASVSRTEPILSPDGRYFADLCDISRPKLGHTIFDRRTGNPITRSFDWPNRLPAALYGWSPNGEWTAWNWRVPHPTNDGTWLRDEVGLVSWEPGVFRWIDIGNQAIFSPDSRYLFWRRPTGAVCVTRVGPKAAPRQKLLPHVEAFTTSA